MIFRRWILRIDGNHFIFGWVLMGTLSTHHGVLPWSLSIIPPIFQNFDQMEKYFLETCFQSDLQNMGVYRWECALHFEWVLMKTFPINHSVLPWNLSIILPFFKLWSDGEITAWDSMRVITNVLMCSDENMFDFSFRFYLVWFRISSYLLKS